jgi:hypothetical protein
MIESDIEDLQDRMLELERVVQGLREDNETPSPASDTEAYNDLLCRWNELDYWYQQVCLDRDYWHEKCNSLLLKGVE